VVGIKGYLFEGDLIVILLDLFPSPDELQSKIIQEKRSSGDNNWIFRLKRLINGANLKKIARKIFSAKLKKIILRERQKHKQENTFEIVGNIFLLGDKLSYFGISLFWIRINM